MRLQHPPDASGLEDKGGRIATEASPLSFETCYTLYTFSPLIKFQHRNTAEDQDISAETPQATRHFIVGLCSGSVIGSQASI